MTFQHEMKLRRLNTMQMRARGLPLVRIAKYQHDIDILEKANQVLMEQIMLVAAQRDALDVSLRKFVHEATK